MVVCILPTFSPHRTNEVAAHEQTLIAVCVTAFEKNISGVAIPVTRHHPSEFCWVVFCLPCGLFRSSRFSGSIREQVRRGARDIGCELSHGEQGISDSCASHGTCQVSGETTVSWPATSELRVAPSAGNAPLQVSRVRVLCLSNSTGTCSKDSRVGFPCALYDTELSCDGAIHGGNSIVEQSAAVSL